MDIILGIIFLLFPLSLLPGLREIWWADAPTPLSANTPVDAVEWLREHPDLTDPLWADLTFESYFVYALPERPVWIDTRFEVYPPEHWTNYSAVNNAAWNWESLLAADDIQTLVLSQKKQANLVSAVEHSSTWQEIYADDVAIIFTRSVE